MPAKTVKAAIDELRNAVQSLENAIQYLLVYDLSAKRDKAKLAANLNGQTGEKIVNRVKW